MRDNRVSAHECGRTGVKLRQLTKKKKKKKKKKTARRIQGRKNTRRGEQVKERRPEDFLLTLHVRRKEARKKRGEKKEGGELSIPQSRCYVPHSWR